MQAKRSASEIKRLHSESAKDRTEEIAGDHPTDSEGTPHSLDRSSWVGKQEAWSGKRWSAGFDSAAL